MMRSFSTTGLLAVALCVCSAGANAQTGGFGGGREARRAEYPTGQGNFGAPPAPPTVSRIALDRAKDLELTDAQRSALEVLRVSQDSTNAPLRARLDSLRPSRMPAGGQNDLSQEQRDEMEQRQRVTRLLMEGFKSNNDAARVSVLAVLTVDQQQKMKDFEDEAMKKFDDDLRKRSRGNEDRGGAGNRGGRGRPPQA